MPKPYSLDLRERVVRFVEAGRSRHAAAAHFGVSVSFVVILMRIYRVTGSLVPKRSGGRRHSKLDPHRAFLSGRVAEKDDITMPELAAELAAATGVEVAPASISRWLIRNGYSFKKRMARPVCKRLFDGISVCANVSGLGAMIVPGQDGAFARADPHKHDGVWRHFFDQDFGTPFDCQAIFPIHSQTLPTRRFPSRLNPDHTADGISLNSKGRRLFNTAQMILAILAASATTALFMCALDSNTRNHSPSGVLPLARVGKAARAPWINIRLR